MTTSKRSWTQLSTTLLCVFFFACSSDDDTTTPTAGTGSPTAGTGGSGANGGSGAAGGSGGKVCINTGEVNDACQPVLTNEPSSGDCAPKGACCHRASNTAKEATLGADEPLNIEYRLNYSLTTNHPKTIGSMLAVMSSLDQGRLEAQNLLWRITVPRMGGKQVSGKGTITPGYGAYNCNGTYSLYSDKAAPAGALSSDPTRWFTKPVNLTVDVTKTTFTDRYHITFADNAQGRQIINTPYVDTSKTEYPLDWELSNMGFHITDMTDKDDCVGSVGGGANGWTAGGHFEVYSLISGNNASKITALGTTYCTLVSFGIGAKAGLDCEKEPRCVPGPKECPWLKLPDSLCPTKPADQAIFGCHLGAKGNINMETGYPADADLKCTDTAPTSVLDPDMGATTLGQCCDPLGTSTTLPACNAHRLINEFTAAAATITPTPTDTLQKNCAVK
jgi:hypothetical protein